MRILTRSHVQCNVGMNPPHEGHALLQCPGCPHLKQFPLLTASPVGLTTLLPPKSDCPLQPELFDRELPELELPARPLDPLPLALDAPRRPLAPRSLPWLLCTGAGSGGSGTFEPVTTSHLQQNVFISRDLETLSTGFQYTIFNTLMEMLDTGEHLRIEQLPNSLLHKSNNCSTLQGTEYLQPVQYITPLLSIPNKDKS